MDEKDSLLEIIISSVILFLIGVFLILMGIGMIVMAVSGDFANAPSKDADAWAVLFGVVLIILGFFLFFKIFAYIIEEIDARS